MAVRFAVFAVGALRLFQDRAIHLKTLGKEGKLKTWIRQLARSTTKNCVALTNPHASKSNRKHAERTQDDSAAFAIEPIAHFPGPQPSGENKRCDTCRKWSCIDRRLATSLMRLVKPAYGRASSATYSLGTTKAPESFGIAHD
ncbi:hypothetical protein SCHPADRAFT_906752 [Schizopora paradoxa]|uniref:Uncharacterized protein n=1 Tax=Schizopora paradoxa TaxID=27342 RepID=A0A0H2RGA9_9AGAM|nr:hypothetical protein SCHPADRAFT_906752 [Schizopora paradoxa]